MDLIEILNYGFIQRALLAGTLVALLCSLLGVFLLLRRLSLIGDGLSHITFGSVALALFLKLYAVSTIIVSLPVVMLASLGILKLTDRTRLNGDAAIGIVSSLGIATGVLLASRGGGFNVDLFSYLFGSILSISKAEVFIAVILFFVVMLLIIFFYNDLLAITFNEELARTAGIRVSLMNNILVLLTALTVVLAMKLVGIMLISALLILPAAAALQVARSFRIALSVSALFATLSVVSGIFTSFALNLPTGATIVVISFFIFSLTFIYRKIFPT
jgi:zinc transport system permease protein